jgi:hypothetical protein
MLGASPDHATITAWMVWRYRVGQHPGTEKRAESHQLLVFNEGISSCCNFLSPERPRTPGLAGNAVRVAFRRREESNLASSLSRPRTRSTVPCRVSRGLRPRSLREAPCFRHLAAISGRIAAWVGPRLHGSAVRCRRLPVGILASLLARTQ